MCPPEQKLKGYIYCKYNLILTKNDDILFSKNKKEIETEKRQSLFCGN